MAPRCRRGFPGPWTPSGIGWSAVMVANHVEHIYTKLGLSSRASATLFATRHGLVGAYETEKMR